VKRDRSEDTVKNLNKDGRAGGGEAKIRKKKRKRKPNLPKDRTEMRPKKDGRAGGGSCV
jgi:hypothetical protein